MNGGLIICECGKEQWVETIREFVSCINCGKSISVYPVEDESSNINGNLDDEN